MNALKTILHFILWVLVQVLIFNEIAFHGYLNPYPYILFITLLPTDISRIGTLLWAFALGLSVDLFENSSGLHAAACTLLGFFKHNIFRAVSVQPDLSGEELPIRELPFFRLFIYTLLAIFIHHFSLFAIENFSIRNLDLVLLRTLYSTGFTLVFSFFYYYLTSGSNARRRR